MEHITLSIKNLDFHYGKLHVLKDISLNIPHKQVTAFIGYSGSGKSTLLRTFNRIYELSGNPRIAGEILLDGQDILSKKYPVDTLRQKVGMVFQRPTPFPMSIFENVAFGLRLHHAMAPSDLGERVMWALNQAALWDEVKDKLHNSGLGLSIGQQQRLCIARTIAMKPEVILLDEPTASLDPLGTRKIETLVEELCKDYTIVIVTHNMKQAQRISHHTAFMQNGHLVEHAPTDTFFNAPTHEETKQYLIYST